MHWTEEELYTIDFYDERLNQRSRRLLRLLTEQPHQSLPASCGGWAELQAAYRFFAHPHVTAEEILNAHRQTTLERAAEEPVVLIAQDTTELDYTRPKRPIAGSGPLNYPERWGLLHHVQLMLTPERLPLGVVGAQTWGRKQLKEKNESQRRATPIEEKESSRWLEGLRQAAEVARELPEQTHVISLSDQEGDIYECFLAGEEQMQSLPNADWIIRNCQNRSLPQRDSGRGPEAYAQLRGEMQHREPLGTLTIDVPRTSKRKARQAVVSVRGGQWELKPPARTGRRLEPVSVGLVWVQEENPPAEEEPLSWWLLTSLTVETLADCIRAIDFYACRYQIEPFFRVLKTGCRIEQLQLQSLDRLEPCLALYMIVAWRVLWLARLGRLESELPCDAVFAEEEWKSVWTIIGGHPLPSHAPSLGEFLPLLASLGGYLGRKHDPPPGPQALWVGLQRMRDFATAWQTLAPAPGS